MPGSTNIFAIPFPCVGDAINSDQFASYSLGVEAALGTVWTDANNALQPPAVSVFNSAGQVIATGVTTAIAENSVNYDRGGFFNLAAPTILTIPSSGSYFLASTSTVNLTGNVTSVRWAFLRNGAEVAYWESQNTGAIIPVAALTLNVFLPALVAGDQITLNALYTGTQPTLSFFGRVNVTRLAIP